MPFPYFLVLFLMGLAAIGLSFGGAFFLAAPLFAFGLVPLLELFTRPKHVNLSPEAERLRSAQKRYDGVLSIVVLAYFALWVFFVHQVVGGAFAGRSLWAASAVMGLVCGGVGINLGHELGHRKSKRAQGVAKALLASSLYMHFFIEHNRGHHSRVATPEDPASSRRGESLYAFLPRSILGGLRSAWQLETTLQKRRGNRVWGLKNEMLRYGLIQGAWLCGAYWIGASELLLAVILAGFTGILLLETVNYLEHYGLQRVHTGRSYEKVQPAHSWNSDHPLGRALLFELSRHSDHHANPKRPFSLLRSFPDAPQLPTGYPGMVLLSLLPPAFFAVMHPRLDERTG
jgi:alkane 1-monooxygenase